MVKREPPSLNAAPQKDALVEYYAAPARREHCRQEYVAAASLCRQRRAAEERVAPLQPASAPPPVTWNGYSADAFGSAVRRCPQNARRLLPAARRQRHASKPKHTANGVVARTSTPAPATRDMPLRWYAWNANIDIINADASRKVEQPRHRAAKHRIIRVNKKAQGLGKVRPGR